MIEGLIHIIPVEFRPMSVMTLILLIVITYMLTQGHKVITNELKKVIREHDILREDFEKAKTKIDKKILGLMQETNKAINSLTVDMAEIKESNKNISTTISEVKTDIRDLRKSK